MHFLEEISAVEGSLLNVTELIFLRFKRVSWLL